ncbi:hypothetical protein LTR97_004134 [Elasticomyces elasticus]|uniref:Uncharacterized protein n=1 Tax=Elasticomyces elasticus TaxID=574655 RepID=A0AAN7WFA6_9PEZI|nr:hypothetical protein LTR97_004134 [Elasticomyces elasticus]
MAGEIRSETIVANPRAGQGQNVVAIDHAETAIKDVLKTSRVTSAAADYGDILNELHKYGLQKTVYSLLSPTYKTRRLSSSLEHEEPESSLRLLQKPNTLDVSLDGRLEENSSTIQTEQDVATKIQDNAEKVQRRSSRLATMTAELQQIAATASEATGKNILLVVKDTIFVWVNASDQTVADPAVRRQAGVACCFYALPSELRKDIYDRYFDLEKGLRTTESGAERPFNLFAIRIHDGVGRRYVEKLAMCDTSTFIRREFEPMFFDRVIFTQSLTLSTTYPNALDLKYAIERIPQHLRSCLRRLRGPLKGCGQDERTSQAIPRFGSLFASRMHLLRGESFRNIQHMRDSVVSITEGGEEDCRLALGEDQLRITYQREKLSWGSGFAIKDLLEGVRNLCERLGSLGYDGFEGVDVLMRK